MSTPGERVAGLVEKLFGFQSATLQTLEQRLTWSGHDYVQRGAHNNKYDAFTAFDKVLRRNETSVLEGSDTTNEVYRTTRV